MSKRLLFIGPKFYNYHEIIKKGFENIGYKVDYFDDRPDTRFLTKVLIRINKKLISRRINSYFLDILSSTKDVRYDVVFVLYGQSFDKNMMLELKKTQPNARFIFYMYDPISSLPDRIDFKDIFDDFYSFDYDDCQRYGLELVPLFYSFKDFEKKEDLYDACFISTMMPGKYALSKEIVEQLEKHNYKVYKFMFIQSKLVYFYFKLKSKDFKGSMLKEFSFNRKTEKELNDIISSSRIIIDCPKEGQSGLTIRTFETLAANKKLITTNKSIINYDFYCPENIYVFDGTIDFDNVFFKTPYKTINDQVKDNYSISSWVNKILANVI